MTTTTRMTVAEKIESERNDLAAKLSALQSEKAELAAMLGILASRAHGLMASHREESREPRRRLDESTGDAYRLLRRLGCN